MVLAIDNNERITKSKRQRMMQQPTNDRSSKGGQWLVTRPSEGCVQQFAAKAAGNKRVNGHMMAYDDKSGWQGQITLQQPINDRGSKGQAVAGDKTA